ncbi:hypothetical protein [Paenibacillus chibensis]|uniref:hypothetical protein n=1 Tax=Paenibacillus chibensis TaxID=59846 RepID=UPI000FDAB3B2|nr:hypothetical protein [Paenibacillus chibensis]MEC0368481.1 hypothetical protein [Paenibacillus chibensis]
MKKHTHLSEEELSIFLEYSKKNQVLFKNKIIQNYFTTDKNKKYLVLSLKGNFENRQALEESFRKHFFQYRFTNSTFAA